MDALARVEAKAFGTPPVQARAQIVDRVPSQNHGYGTDLLKALATVELVRAVHVVGRPMFSEQATVAAADTQVRAGDAESGLLEKPTSDGREEPRSELEVGVELDHDVPRLGELVDAPSERRKLCGRRK